MSAAPSLRPFGDAGFDVTPLGLGLAALGRPGYINLGHADDLGRTYAVEAMEAHAHAVLDAAWEAGIRYVDAARSYGRAEVFLASWIEARGLAPDALAVGSKWGYTYTAGWQVDAAVHEVKEHSLEVLERQWAESRERLGPHLDLYQIHSATFESGVLDNTDVLAALARLKEAGVAIGLSLSGPNQAEVLARALGTTVDGVRLFDGVQATYNLLERSVGDRLAEAHAAGLGVIVKEALANGRLTPRNPDFDGRLDPIRVQAERLQTTPDALALAAVLAEPWATVVLSGAATTEHLASNAEAVEVAWDDEAATALAALAQDPHAYWTERDALPWN